MIKIVNKFNLASGIWYLRRADVCPDTGCGCSGDHYPKQ
jgi:hypothetical protein